MTLRLLSMKNARQPMAKLARNVISQRAERCATSHSSPHAPGRAAAPHRSDEREGQHDHGQRDDDAQRQRGEVLDGVGQRSGWIGRSRRIAERALADLEVHLPGDPRAGELPDDERGQEVGGELGLRRSGRPAPRAATADHSASMMSGIVVERIQTSISAR